jgi:hypothetical protein
MYLIARKGRTRCGVLAASTFLFTSLALPYAAAGQSGSSGTPKAATASLGSGIQLRVECSNPRAPLKTIGAALKLVGHGLPTTLLVSGTCHENVEIQGLTNVTLQGNPTATIDGGSDPNSIAVDLSSSQNIALNNLTITGGGVGLNCVALSDCALTQVTIQNSQGVGANVNGGAHLAMLDCVIQNNADVGLSVGAGTASLIGGQITGNGSDGVSMRFGGIFTAAPADVNDNATIQNNSGNGIRASLHNTVTLNTAVITGNGADGVTLQLGSAMNMLASSITNNGGHQVRIGDLSVARFSGGPSNTVTGANFPDVVCDPQFSATRQLSNAPGVTTNCAAELPPAP